MTDSTPDPSARARTAAPSTARGLPMTSRWDPQKLAREVEALQELEGRPLAARLRGYFKLTGPAWMQSAMTLGAGSAVASVVAGAFYGYNLLWVQPIAMLLGVAMMAALANIVLTKGERAYSIFARELHPAIALLWALATIVATIIWHFPQYALAGAAVWDIASTLGIRNPPGARAAELAVKFAGGFAILGVNTYMVWSYGSKPAGIKLYEGFLRWMIRIVILAFLVVVIKSGIGKGFHIGAMLRGFAVPSIPEGATTTILGAIGAAVGINMTFLYPYSILAKGWGKHHKGLARFDLLGSLLLPYVILTSLIIIAMASTIHQPPFGTNLPGNPPITGLKPIDAAQSLAGILGQFGGRIIFDLGFFGMACGAISAHMVVSGFTFCEMLGLEYTPARYRRFALVPAIGLIGVAFPSPLWMPIVASAIAFSMLPIAYISFFILNNKRRYLGDAVGRGPRRWLYNAVLFVAMAMSLVGAAMNIKERVIAPIQRMLAPPAPAAIEEPAETEPGHGRGAMSGPESSE